MLSCGWKSEQFTAGDTQFENHENLRNFVGSVDVCGKPQARNHEIAVSVPTWSLLSCALGTGT